MSTIKDYSIIETEWFKKRIEELRKTQSRLSTKNDYEEWNEFQKRIDLLEEIQSKLKPLTPIVENAFDSGVLTLGHFVNETKENYINNTIIE